MRTLRHAFGILPLTIACAASCGSGRTQGPAAVDPAVCNAYFDALQAFLACSVAARATGVDEPWPNALAPTVDEPGFARAYCGAIAKAPGAESLADEMRACAAWLTSPAACQAPWGQVDLSCTLRGSLPASAACQSNVQCQSGVCEGATTPGGACGTCASLVASGQPCERSAPPPAPQPTCDVGLVCKYVGATTACQPFLQQGDACTVGDAASTPCQPPLACDSLAQVCTPPAGAGASCATTACVPGTTCITPSCTAKPCPPPVCTAWLAEGQPCTTGSASCGEGLYCPTSPGGDAGAATGVCTKFPVAAAGESCVSGPPYPVCVAGTTCNGSVCAPFPAAGDPCDSSGCGEWLVCTNGACLLPDPSACR